MTAKLYSLLQEKGLSSAVSPYEQTRPESAAATTGFATLDELLRGGLPQGEISECLGDLSSGCTTVALSVLARASSQGELTAYIDAADCFDPTSASRAGVPLDSLLWVRCEGRFRQKPERRARRTARSVQAWKAAHLLASAGGFGVIVLDLLGLSGSELRGLQRSPWFGLRQAISHSSTTILTLSPEHVTGSVGALTLSFKREQARWKGSSGVSLRLAGLSTRATILHQRRSIRGQAGSCRLEAER